MPTVAELDSLLVIARALVIAFDPSRKGVSNGFARDLPLKALEHGVKVVFVGTLAEIELLRAHSGTLPPECVACLVSPAKHVVAEEAARHDPGPSCNFFLSLKGDPLSTSDEILIRRSFSDFRAVTLKSQTGGKSGARVYLVHAEPAADADVNGNYTMPYFAKIDRLDKVREEKRAFERFASRYIPFSQRPNLELTRCVSGAKNGVLVGDFVEGALPLAKMVRPFGARQVIHSLFDDALACFRQQAFANGKTINVREFWKEIVKPDRILDVHWQTAKTYGAKVSPSRLSALIEKASFTYRAGPIHGDLNAENVFARHNEAVLIDFCRATVGPLVSDLACLEVAVAFTEEAKSATADWLAEGGPYSSDPHFKEWRKHIDALFSLVPGQFAIVPPPSELPCRYAWIWSVSRQLRLMGHYLDRDDRSYAFILGLYLLRLCMYDDDPREGSPDRSMRGFAYSVGLALISQSLKGAKSR
ncbi:MAG: phosphotransferase [Nitrospira sp.]|nr:phosphotransferase [Nitrospira sp.]